MVRSTLAKADRAGGLSWTSRSCTSAMRFWCPTRLAGDANACPTFPKSFPPSSWRLIGAARCCRPPLERWTAFGRCPFTRARECSSRGCSNRFSAPSRCFSCKDTVAHGWHLGGRREGASRAVRRHRPRLEYPLGGHSTARAALRSLMGHPSWARRSPLDLRRDLRVLEGRPPYTGTTCIDPLARIELRLEYPTNELRAGSRLFP